MTPKTAPAAIAINVTIIITGCSIISFPNSFKSFNESPSLFRKRKANRCISSGDTGKAFAGVLHQ